MGHHPILTPDGRGVRDPEEVAAALGMSGNTIRKAVRCGQIIGSEIGTRIVIPVHEVAACSAWPDAGRGEMLVPAVDAVA